MNRASQTGKKGRKPTHIGGIIDSLMGSLGLRNSYNGWLVVHKWPEIVGTQIARRSEAFRFEDGTLYVAVADAVWRQEMSMQLGDILKEIRSLPYGHAVKQVRLVQGRKGK